MNKVLEDIERSLQWLVERAEEDALIREALEKGLYLPNDEKANRAWEV